MIEAITLLLIGSINAYILKRIDGLEKVVSDTNRKVERMTSNFNKRRED